MKKRRKLFYRHRLASSIFYLFSFATLICTVSIVYTSITSSLNISGEGIVDGPVNEYYYKSGYFYKDEACKTKVTSNGSDVTKFSDMVNIAKDGNTIYMMSNYTVGVGTEEVNVGAKNIQVKRHSSFEYYSMFDIQVLSSSSSEYRTLTIKAEDSNGSIVFDGQNIEVSNSKGGIFNLYGATAKLNIIGSEKSNGEKNVKLINNKLKESDVSGGVIYNYFNSITELTNCELSNNSIYNSSSSYKVFGGAIESTTDTTLILNSCTIRNNIASGTSSDTKGGGVYNDKNITIKGKTIIENNKSIINEVEKEDNLYLYSSTVDTSGLTSGSRIGITTSTTPTRSSNVTISPSGSAASTASYFFSDNSDYKVVKLSDGSIALVFYKYYYQSGYFYEDEACTVKVTSNGADVTKFSDMVNIATDGNIIYIMNSYVVSNRTEEVTVGAKNIQVKRHPSFTDDSMFYMRTSSSSQSSVFTIKAEDSNGSIVFDGNNVECSRMYGGIFNLYGANVKFNIIGSEKSNGEKNVKLINSKLKAPDAFGSAIFNNWHSGCNLTNCELSNNSAYCTDGEHPRAVGGAIYNLTSTLVLDNCIIRNNIASGTSNSLEVEGGGVYSSGTILKGKTIIENNKSIIDGVEKTDNLRLYPDTKIDTSGLTSGSRIGITTSKAPTSSSNVTISPSGSAASTASYFFSDNSDYTVVKLSDGSIVLTLCDKYYYKSGYFYKDEACTVKVTSNSSDVRKFSDMVNIANDRSTIYMMSQYDVGVGTEEVTVGAKNIQVKRHPSFTNNSMFYISSWPSASSSEFTIKAENSNGSIVFDGQNIKSQVTSGAGGAFQVSDPRSKLQIIGKENASGEKNVRIIFNKMEDSQIEGGAISNYAGGVVDLTNCELSNNSIYCSNSSSVAWGGAISSRNSTTLTLDSCTIRNNIASGSNDRVRGGGVYFYDNMTIKGKTIIEGNKSIINGVGKTDNLYLDSSTVDTSGLTSGSRIGITTSKTPTSSSTVTISPSGKAASTADYFFSDVSRYVVELVNNALVLKVG
ncbi:MAG: hypothetical protein Q4B84_04095 [Clostridia bacterium]|nr:hypothetical protein [Clostridia bacterium]